MVVSLWCYRYEVCIVCLFVFFKNLIVIVVLCGFVNGRGNLFGKIIENIYGMVIV